METKEYVVALHEGVDYDQFWLDMENVTSGLPHIPDRAVSITNNRTAFKRLCEYALTDDEADRVRNDHRVVGIEIPVRNNPNVSIVNNIITEDKNFSKTLLSTASGNEVNWGLIRHNYSNNSYGNTSSTFKTTDRKYNYTLDGSGVDVVINDSGLQIDHPEFAGRVIQVDWESYYPPGAGYLNTNSRQDLNGHGTHVAGIAAGTTYGWAKGANVVPLVNSSHGSSQLDPLDCFEALINWHISKNGSRPTIVNMSWELRLNWNDANGDYRNYITGGSYRNNPILSGQTANNYAYYKKIGLIDLMQGLPLQDTGTPLYLPYTSMAYNAALAEVINAGIIVVQAAGNNNFKMDKPVNDGGTGDYNNYFSLIGAQPVYYHRGSSPRDPRAIVVGNLYVGPPAIAGGKEAKSPDSTKGPRIDIWAAGSQIMSSCSNTYSLPPAIAGPYPHGTENEKSFKQICINGTSMASPQIAGMCALYLQKNKTATMSEIKAWIKNTSIKGLLYSPSNASDDYENYWSLLGSDTGIAFQNLQAELTTKSYIKDNTNTWREAKTVWVKHADGTWKQARSGWQKNNAGTWDKIYQL